MKYRKISKSATAIIWDNNIDTLNTNGYKYYTSDDVKDYSKLEDNSLYYSKQNNDLYVVINHSLFQVMITDYVVKYDDNTYESYSDKDFNNNFDLVSEDWKESLITKHNDLVCEKSIIISLINSNKLTDNQKIIFSNMLNNVRSYIKSIQEAIKSISENKK